MGFRPKKIKIFFVELKKAIIFVARFNKFKKIKSINWEISSAGSEHLPYKQGVTGSNPVSPTLHGNNS